MTKELAIIDQVRGHLAELPAMAGVLAENLGDGGLTPQDLTRIRVPSGGGLAWEYPTASGPEPRPTFEGVILHRQNTRAYWAQSLEAGNGNTPPDCRSDDAIVGVGIPGGRCDTCPLSQFGSKEGTNAQACKALTLLYVMVPGELLPVVVVAPPTSLKPLKTYMLQLTSAGVRYWTAITRFALEQTKNAGGIKYSRLALQRVETLGEAEAAALSDVRAQLAPLFGQAPIDVRDYQVD